MYRTLYTQIGWTLPFMWIFLVGIGSAIFFFGWWTLLYIVAGAVMITAATFTYDLFGYGTRDHSGQARI